MFLKTNLALANTPSSHSFPLQNSPYLREAKKLGKLKTLHWKKLNDLSYLDAMLYLKFPLTRLVYTCSIAWLRLGFCSDCTKTLSVNQKRFCDLCSCLSRNFYACQVETSFSLSLVWRWGELDVAWCQGNTSEWHICDYFLITADNAYKCLWCGRNTRKTH